MCLACAVPVRAMPVSAVRVWAVRVLGEEAGLGGATGASGAALEGATLVFGKAAPDA
jgi:hypothetical protein